MKFFLILSLLFLTISMAGADMSLPDPPNLLTVHEIHQMLPDKGTFHVDGYVVDQYSCLPCPVEGACPPCMSDHVTIEEDVNGGEEKDLQNEMIIFVDKNAEFEIGKRYRFLIQFLNVRTTGQPMNNAKMIYAQEIRSKRRNRR